MLAIEYCKNAIYQSQNDVYFPCGQCINCKKKKFTEWSIRGRDELNYWKGKAAFITISYNDNNLIKTQNNYRLNDKDAGGSLCREHMVEFIKGIKKIYGKHIRYIYCGEYGPKTFRPHYHLLIFGVSQREVNLDILAGIKYGKSKLVNLWKKGAIYLSINEKTGKPYEKVSSRAVQYIVGYTRKKLPSAAVKEFYNEIEREKPFMSTSQGIGKGWAEENKENWVHNLRSSINNVKCCIPRYYIKRVYKEEGKVTRYKNDYSKSYTYKVIKNTDGRLTKIILQTKYKIMQNNIEMLKLSNTYNPDEIEYIGNKLTENYVLRLKHDIELNREANTDIVKLTRKIGIRANINHRQRIKNDKYVLRKYNVGSDGRITHRAHWLSKETFEKLQGMAVQKELNIINSQYGKRDKFKDDESVLLTYC